MKNGQRTRGALPELGRLLFKTPGFGLLMGPIAYMAAELADRFLEHRQPIIDRQRWTFDENVFPNVAAMERAFGLLNTAPLSPEQASTFRRTS